MHIIHALKYPFHYAYTNVLYPHALNYRYRGIIRKNRALRDTHKGKRCFILGTGPSIKDFDLVELKDEYTFAVNDMDKHPRYRDLNAKFYAIADTTYFISKSDDDFWGLNLKHKTENISPSTRLLLNIKARPLIEQKNIFSHHPITYISYHGIFSDKIPFNIGLDKTVPYPKNVVLACMIAAVYMGFEELYLLGCEHSYLSNPTGLGKIKTVSHFYSTEDEKKIDPTKDIKTIQERGLQRDVEMSYEKYMVSVLQLFKNYRHFSTKVEQTHPRVKIYNTTPNTFLDIFPCIDFDDIEF
ncbi:MAG: hypothetical protein WC659_00405 [Patescibacteria group bacterium]